MSEDSIFAAAVAIANPSERAAFLDRHCAADPRLRERLAARVAGCARSDEFRLGPAESGAPGPTVVIGAPPSETDPLDELRGVIQPPLKAGAVGRLGQYELLRVLGKGGFGVVLRGFDDVLQREVAIKVLIGDAAKNRAAQERFLREARAAAPIRHENVVQVYAIHAEPVPHLVMELVPGASLQDLIDRAAPLPAPLVVALGAQLARGLAAAHARGVVHRDLKPANVLVEGPDAAPRAKLTDFGLARAGDDTSLTQSGMVAGTPMYMSPEQARGEPLDARSDLFSLGGVLYAMATGRPPFRGATSLAVMRQLCDYPHEPVTHHAPDAPAWLCAVVDKLLAKEAADRYQSASAVADALLPAPAVAPVAVAVPPAPRAPTSSETFGQLDSQSATARVTVAAPVLPPKARKANAALVVAVLAVCVSAVLAVASVAALVRSRDDGGAKRAPEQPNEQPKEQPKPPAVALAPPPRAKISPPPVGGEYVGVLDMKFVRVSRGVGLLGGGSGNKKPEVVGFDYDTFVAVYEVTQGQYERVTGTNPSLHSKTGARSHLVMNVPAENVRNFPVENVTLNEARAFAKRLNELHPIEKYEYRLPSTQEWEYACRGGPMQNPKDANFDFYFDGPPTNNPGAAKLKDVGVPRPEQVTNFRKNRIGIFNMHGNVAEWCDDGPGQGPIKGGSYLDTPDIAAAATKMRASGNAGIDGVGFRVILAPLGTPKKK